MAGCVAECIVCKRTLGENEGLISSTGAIACSNECAKNYTESLPNKGKASLFHYSRVTGYYTPIESWNAGKLHEFKDRVRYSIKEGIQ